MLLKFQSRRLTDPPGVEVGWGCAEEAVSLLRIRVFRATSETHGRGRGPSDGWEFCPPQRSRRTRVHVADKLRVLSPRWGSVKTGTLHVMTR